jgi:NAD+ kinase
MNKAIIIPNPNKDTGLLITRKVISKLSSLSVLPYVSEDYSELSGLGAEIYSEIPKDAEMVIVVGGDGSVIDASRTALLLSVPILGVNMGKVGYLSEVDPNRLEILERLATDCYSVEERMLLTAKKTAQDGKTVSFDRFAVNDVVISHESYLGITDFKICNRRGDSVSYRADGIIFSTSQGSTAYSLSAGGPIVAHNLDTVIMTPICPHSLFNRSIIFEPDECITIRNTGTDSLNVSLDGRLVDALLPNESCTITRAEKRLKTVTFSEGNMFSTLFRKIKVLED